MLASSPLTMSKSLHKSIDDILPALHHALSGSAGTLISTCAVYPLSLVVTRLQVQVSILCWPFLVPPISFFFFSSSFFGGVVWSICTCPLQPSDHRRTAPREQPAFTSVSPKTARHVYALFLTWLIPFLSFCSPGHHNNNTVALLSLAYLTTLCSDN